MLSHLIAIALDEPLAETFWALAGTTKLETETRTASKKEIVFINLLPDFGYMVY
jgi:hypothetical protein